MVSFKMDGLEQLDETTAWLERMLEDRQENAESVGEGYLLRNLAQIVAELREASTDIRYEVLAVVGEGRRIQEKNNEYRDQISQLRKELRVSQQERDEFQRCYNAHYELLNEREAVLERVLLKNQHLEDYAQDLAEASVVKDKKISDLEQAHDDECRRKMDFEVQLKKAHAQLGKWRVAVAHERAWNGGNLRGKGAAAEYSRLNGHTNYSTDFWLAS